ncbi:Uncharacterized protein TCAP_02994, partial [Tolypocladium capitatum]
FRPLNRRPFACDVGQSNSEVVEAGSGQSKLYSSHLTCEFESGGYLISASLRQRLSVFTSLTNCDAVSYIRTPQPAHYPSTPASKNLLARSLHFPIRLASQPNMRASVVSCAVTVFMAAGVHAGSMPSYSYDPKTPKNCNRWYDNDGRIPCMAIPAVMEITREQYLAWNPSLDKDTCEPYNKKQSYCIGVCEKNCTTSTTTTTSSTTSTTTTVSTSTCGPPVATPTPVQDGMVKGCKVFSLVTKGLTCIDIANQYGLEVSDLVSFNPAFKDCSNLLPGYYACVGIRKPK